MKKNLRKILSTALVLIIAFSLSLTAFAADITKSEAMDIAIKDSGYNRSNVIRISANLDIENGVKVYDVDFDVEVGNTRYEYDYDIRVSDGKILSKNVETEVINSTTPGSTTNKDIGEAAALKAAYTAFGLSADEVKLIKVKKDYDDGVLVYEVEFAKGYDCEYSCDVVAATGAVLDAETDISRNIFDKIELFFKVLFAQLFNR